MSAKTSDVKIVLGGPASAKANASDASATTLRLRRKLSVACSGLSVEEEPSCLLRHSSVSALCLQTATSG